MGEVPHWNLGMPWFLPRLSSPLPKYEDNTSAKYYKHVPNSGSSPTLNGFYTSSNHVALIPTLSYFLIISWEWVLHP